MPIYWKASSIPELQDLPPHQRHRIMDAAREKVSNRWGVFAGLIVCVIAVVLGEELLHSLKLHKLLRIVLFYAGLTVLYLIYTQWFITILRPLIWQLRNFCPQCGYNLKATPDRCPECGTVFSTPSSTSQP